MNIVEGKRTVKQSLSPEELEFIEVYRRASPEAQRIVRIALEPYKRRYEGKLIQMSINTSKPVHERLSEARQRKGLSVLQVAYACGITEKSITDYEAGESIPRDEIKIALAKLYGVPVLDLFF